MTRHLSDEALLAVAEGAVSGREHLDTCAACRARVLAMRDTLRMLNDDAVPEPSPLFWEHFSQRVARAIDDEPVAARPYRTIPRWIWGLGAVGCTIAVVLSVMSVRWGPLQRITDQPMATAPAQVTPTPDTASDVSWVLAETDPSWQIIEGAAQDLDLDGAADAGIFVTAGSVEREVLMLSDSERRALALVIQTELDRLRL